jgi:hypothetical protein
MIAGKETEPANYSTGATPRYCPATAPMHVRTAHYQDAHCRLAEKCQPQPDTLPPLDVAHLDALVLFHVMNKATAPVVKLVAFYQAHQPRVGAPKRRMIAMSACLPDVGRVNQPRG